MRPAPIAAILVLLGVLPAAPAEPQALTTRYTVSLLGLPVGRAVFQTVIEGDAYTVSGSLSSAGIADLVSRTNGTSSVAGRIADDRLYAERYRLAYTSEDKPWSSDVQYRSGAVRSAAVTPKPKKPPSRDFIAVEPSQLRAVVDPLSGLMIKPGADPTSICNRTLPIYDGWARIDLQLEPAGRRQIDTRGYSGEAVICQARVVPVSGYRTSSSGLDYLRRQTLQFWFAPAGNAGIWAPVYVRIPTKIGPLSITATEFAAPSTGKP